MGSNLKRMNARSRQHRDRRAARNIYHAAPTFYGNRGFRDSITGAGGESISNKSKGIKAAKVEEKGIRSTRDGQS